MARNIAAAGGPGPAAAGGAGWRVAALALLVLWLAVAIAQSFYLLLLVGAGLCEGCAGQLFPVPPLAGWLVALVVWLVWRGRTRSRSMPAFFFVLVAAGATYLPAVGAARSRQCPPAVGLEYTLDVTKLPRWRQCNFWFSGDVPGAGEPAVLDIAVYPVVVTTSGVRIEGVVARGMDASDNASLLMMYAANWANAYGMRTVTATTVHGVEGKQIDRVVNSYCVGETVAELQGGGGCSVRVLVWIESGRLWEASISSGTQDEARAAQIRGYLTASVIPALAPR